MKKIIKLAYLNFIKWLLPWISSVVTALPYTDKRSLFLDRFVYLLEN